MTDAQNAFEHMAEVQKSGYRHWQRCPHCKKTFKVDDENAKALICPECGKEINSPNKPTVASHSTDNPTNK